MQNGFDDETAYRPRDGQRKTAESSLSGVEKQDELECDCPTQGGGVYEPQEGDQVTAYLLSQWSGELPDPASFNEYPQSAQDAMIAWNNARVLEESKRQDELCHAVIKQSRLDSILNAVIQIAFPVLSVVAFAITRDPASFGLLAVPGLTIVVNTIRAVRDEDR